MGEGDRSTLRRYVRHRARREILLAAPALPALMSHSRTFLISKILKAADRFFTPISLQADRYDGKFLLALTSVLGFTLLAHWTLTDYWDVQWFAGEDGVSEWWSVATYLLSAAMATVAARTLARLGHPRIRIVYLVVAVTFVFGMLEEISWGQRLFGWSTPESLTSINEQDETTLHNITELKAVFLSLIFWGSTLALIGAILRAILHHRRVTSADFLLPSLVLAPTLLMIMFWIGGGQSFPGNPARIVLTHFDLNPVGSEIPEVLVGFCLLLYTYGNLRRVVALRNHRVAGGAGISG